MECGRIILPMKSYLWLAAVLLACSSLYAQNPVYQVGQIVVVTVTYQGKDASKVSSSNFVFRLAGKPLDTQNNFNTDFGCGDAAKVVSPGTVEISCKIGISQADGEYNLLQIGASFSEVGVNALYQGSDFPARKITIQNHSAFTKPSIKDVQVH